jgi:hypothetical protein
VARTVDLREHCCRRVARSRAELEEQLYTDGRARSNGLAICEQVEVAMFRHVGETSELWCTDVSRAGKKP